MKKGNSFLAITICILILGCNFEKKEIKKLDALAFFDTKRNEITPKFENLSVNDIKPEGWIKAIMVEDISEGFMSNLDKLAPKLMSDDAFNSARRKNAKDIPSVGNQELTGADWEISMQWWAGETLGNWWDGYLRNAYMTNNKIAIPKINNIVAYLLSGQDEDGYLGIYSKEMRYKHKGSNGELWSQTVLFRMLLGYYEFTGNAKVLQAVEKAMTVTMKAYNEGEINPFEVPIDYGGVTHGLMMTDVCETLYRITKDKKYNDYAVYLYRDFSEHSVNRSLNDARYDLLMEKDSLFQSHSAHTYEHLRSVLLAKQITGYSQLDEAFKSAMNKLSNCILPSGAGFGNEWLNRQKSDPNTTAAEFCGMLELRNFYTSALQKTGKILYADNAEKMTYNAMQGTRDSNGKSITYCKTDNCYVLNKKAPQAHFEEFDFRYKYSPTHADAAVCCNPSYGRHLPYFVSNMFMKSDDGIAALLYGPSTLTTNYKGVNLKIEEQTNYPFSDDITFVFTADKEVEFNFYVRKPNWSAALNIVASKATITQKEGYYSIHKKWKTGDTVQVHFKNELFSVAANNGESAVQRGALVYALEIPHRVEIVKQYDIAGFTDYMVFATAENYKNLELRTSENNSLYGLTYVSDKNKLNPNPWYDGNTYLSGKLLNTKSNKLTEVKLIPMGSTTLRRITFPIKK
jgi:DUF1680 family protein